MTALRYSEYKESDEGWLGKIPLHWNVVPGRRLFCHKREASKPGDEQLSATQKYGVVPQRLFMELEEQKVTLALGGLDNFKHVEKNDFVISLRSFQGGIEGSQYTGCVSPAYTVLRSTQPIDSEYWALLLKSAEYITALQSVTDGIRDGKNISYDQFGRIGLPVPPIDEQAAIATFINRETAKADELVNKQEQLILLLKEKREAIISHTVTKGLDPTASMKDSGIEWIGEVPEHWSVSKLGYVASEQGGKTPSKENQKYWDGEIPWVSPKDMKTSVISDSIDHITPIAVDECGMTMIPENAVLVVVRGMILAHSFPVAETVQSVTINQDMKALISIKGVLSGYLRLVLESAKPYVVSVLVAEAAHGTRVLRTDIWKRLSVLMPPQIEQQRIIEHVSSVSEEYKRLVSQIERGIALLKERRSSLISAAVTGKIDVRGLVREEVTA